MARCCGAAMNQGRVGQRREGASDHSEGRAVRTS